MTFHKSSSRAAKKKPNSISISHNENNVNGKAFIYNLLNCDKVNEIFGSFIIQINNNMSDITNIDYKLPVFAVYIVRSAHFQYQTKDFLYEFGF
jgi:hypothetical protein